MNKLVKDAEKFPLVHILIVSLLGTGLWLLPLDKLFALFISDLYLATILGGSTMRLITAGLAVFMIFKYGFYKQFKLFNGFKSLLVTLPFLLVSLNNLPIIGLALGNVQTHTNTAGTLCYILYCLSIGLCEELVFRGIVFPLCLKITSKLKQGVFWGIAMSSAIFGVLHLLNLFNGAGVGATFLQVGYSFLIGGMCAVSVCVTGNIFSAVLLHFIYDIGGLMTGNLGIAVGNPWDTATIIITAVLGVIVLAYTLAILFRLKTDKVNCKYIPNEISNLND